ncbi:39S mitochondrial ribosomal protein L46-domain-containing protein [Exophiala viscosa]|uniref:39S mitochondrial ribosomal protein L46-domain-containing protein n=1 Tax=Exophiala viscosa TaxID=2486360 RepID=UPI0021A19FE1|nr:39S mitochondrial ribosomal protein L46-domain-containing protein [Exophiala viscosa]
MSPRSRGVNLIADVLGTSAAPLAARRVLTRSGFSSQNHICRSCRQALSQQQHRNASTATAKATVEAPPITQLSPDGPEASPVSQPIYSIKAGVVVSRPPLLTPDPHPFETAYHLYQRRLNERLVLPFTQYFYYKRNTPAFEQWRTKRRERGGVAARDIGKYNAYTEESWNDEALVGDESGAPEKIVKDLVAEEGRAEEFTGAGDATFAGLRRKTEADEKNDQRSLERSLHRTLYLLVKNKTVNAQQDESELWRFPSGTIAGFEGLKEAAQRILFASLGANMNTFFVGNHPVGHYVQKFTSPIPRAARPPTTTQKDKASKEMPLKQDLAAEGSMVDGEKTFFMKARIMAGQADLSVAQQGGEIEDFKWLSKDEVEALVHPDYWTRVKNMLVAQ